MKYDKEEKAIIDDFEKGEMKLSTPSKKEIEAIKATARKTLRLKSSEVESDVLISKGKTSRS